MLMFVGAWRFATKPVLLNRSRKCTYKAFWAAPSPLMKQTVSLGEARRNVS